MKEELCLSDLPWVVAEEEDVAGPAYTVSWPSTPTIAQTSHRQRGKIGPVSIAAGYGAGPRLVRTKKKSSIATVVRFYLNREEDRDGSFMGGGHFGLNFFL
ncbi:hypothetical protein MRB53_009959 [Persea americana]|uniref:Uncharacterized protein n=1 Tax=Persea americana TaxID=3435 RepID=A0ACC2LQM3_PERAE|nr:hypothetical protein MRB53_009959 [Persea americana]